MMWLEGTLAKAGKVGAWKKTILYLLRTRGAQVVLRIDSAGTGSPGGKVSLKLQGDQRVRARRPEIGEAQPRQGKANVEVTVKPICHYYN